MPLPPLRPPAQLPRRALGFARGLVASTVLLATLLVFNLGQTASLLLRPVSGRLFRALNRWGANTWWGWCAAYARHIYRIRFERSGDPLPPRENALVLPNHQEMTDIPVLFELARRAQRLGDMKWFVKDVVKFVPGVGWGMLFLDCVFVKRDWTRDRDSVRATFAKLVRDRIPMWLVTFTEGTRVRPSKLASSQRYAEREGLEPLRHLLLPRTKGFVAAVEGLREHADAIYDVTIGYVEGVPTLWQWACGYARQVHVHTRRFAMNELPQGAEELRTWLLDRFREKDALLEHYYLHGSFPSASVQAESPTT